jgi:tetratricopeptide (TPR) repeat protein
MNLTPELLDEEGKSILFARVASKLHDEGKIDQATLISEVGIKKHPNYAQGHYILGKCYQEKDMYEEARAEYERVLRYDSSHLGVLKKLAGLYNATGLNDVYKDYLYRLLTLDPLNSSILDECKEQGIYEYWKSSNSSNITTEENYESGIEDSIGFSLEEEKKSVELEVESEKKDTEDLLKIDLNQFENQEDDFTTIMDGLIQETSEENSDADTTNYLKDLESPIEIESELLAEEKPIEESIDELDAFEKEELLDDSKSSFLELDYGQEVEKKEETNEELENDILKIDKEEETFSIEEEIKKEPEEVENAFEEPKLRLENIEIKDEAQENNAHEKTELIFEESDKNVELQFEEDEIKKDIEEDTETDLLPEEEVENESEEESPYVKQKIVSQTLGEILVSQNKYKEAKQVFLALKAQQPDNPNIDKKLDILDKIIALEDNKKN